MRIEVVFYAKCSLGELYLSENPIVIKAQISDELEYKILNALEANPNMSQRQLPSEVGLSLGKVYYCLKALMEAGWIKMINFARSSDRSGYANYLVSRGER